MTNGDDPDANAKMFETTSVVAVVSCGDANARFIAKPWQMETPLQAVRGRQVNVSEGGVALHGGRKSAANTCEFRSA